MNVGNARRNRLREWQKKNVPYKCNGRRKVERLRLIPPPQKKKKKKIRWLAQCGFKHQACDCIEILRQSLLSQHFGFDPVWIGSHSSVHARFVFLCTSDAYRHKWIVNEYHFNQTNGEKFLPQETTPTTAHRPVDIWYINGPPESPCRCWILATINRCAKKTFFSYLTRIFATCFVSSAQLFIADWLSIGLLAISQCPNR